jgi:hypothetical protein
VAAGWLLSFTLSMDDVVVSSFVTGPGYEILPLKIYSMVKGWRFAGGERPGDDSVGSVAGDGHRQPVNCT